MTRASTSESSGACLLGRELRPPRRRVWVDEELEGDISGADETDRKPQRVWRRHSGYCGCVLLHPHIHCVIPAGGLSPDHRRWVRPRYPFFLPVKVLSRVFRGKFLAGLKRLHRSKKLQCAGPAAAIADPQQFAKLLRRLHRHDWVVYAKPAFGGPMQVLRYLGRYTHRVAISNHRLLAFDQERVTFRWKDY